ncbi:tape measure protein [Microbacterium lacticum]|uniref:phage tail protein n=1 Tax=Microbacterium lacticum TaxID=33885 RepID=UPI0028D5CD49|nr:tape measure protein [Microbacterium lacticum]
MSSEVGSGHIAIYPVMTGFKAKVAKETQSAGAAGAKTFEGGFKGVGARSGRALGKDLKSALDSSAGNLGADSMKKLTSEVASASSALARVRMKQQDDAGRVRIAETRLAEAVAKSGASSSQAVAAEERLASARRTHASTTEAVSAATGRLKTAQGALSAAQNAGTTSTSRFSAGLASLGRSAQSGFQSVVSAAGRAASAVGEALGSGIRNAATGAVTVAAAGIAVAFTKGFSRLTAIDTARAKLTGLGNDGETVAKIMTNATNAVSGTAFGLGEAASVAAAAVAAQIKPGEQLEKHLKTIANNAAAAGTSMQDMGSIFNKAATQANGVQNDVIGQLADKGIPIYQALADQMGVTAGEVFKLASDGKVSFEMFAAAAEAAAGTVADEIGKTVPGALANIGARLGRIGAGVFGGINKDTGEMFGLYARLGPLLASINAALGPVQARAEKFGELLDKILGPALDWVTNLLTKIGEGASLAEMGFGGLQGILGPLVGVFAALGAGGLGGLLTKIPQLSSLIPGLTGALSLLGGPLGIAAAAFAGFALSGGDVGGLVQSIVGILDQVVAALPGVVAQIATFIPQLVDSILQQVPALLNAAHGIVTVLVEGIVQSIPVLVVGAVSLIRGLVDALIANLPTIITGAINLVMALLQGIVSAIPLLVQGAVLLVTSLLNGIVAMLPMIIQGGIQLLMSLVMGIIQALPVLLQAAIDLVMGLLGAIIANLPMIIGAGIQLLLSLVTGLINALPQLITAAISLVLQLVAGILKMLPQLIKAGITLVVSLINGLVQAIPQIIQMLPQIISAIWDGLANVDWLGLGAEIIQGIIDGFFSMVGSVGDAIGSVLGGILDFFPHSPAKKGPLSVTGWRQLRSSGAATMEQFTAGAEDGAGSFGAALAAVAESASTRVQGSLSGIPVGITEAGARSSYVEDGAATVIQYITTEQTDPRIQMRQWGREARGAFAAS